MDTGGKIATGVLVPLAVGGAVVAAYFLFFKKSRWTASDGSPARKGSVLARLAAENPKVTSSGGRHHTRRHRH